MNIYDWKNNPSKSFDAFIRSTDFSKTGRGNSTSWTLQSKSITVYSFMFTRFLRWIELEKIKIHKLSSLNAKRFFESLDGTTRSEIKWRYIRLLERVYDHLFDINIVQNNPISNLLIDNKYSRNKVVTYKNADTAFISDSDRIKLRQHLLSLNFPEKNKNHRDAVLTIIMLNGGLKLSEALRLMKKDFILKGETIHLKINTVGISKPRIIKINEFVDKEMISIITTWVEAYKDNEFVFCGTGNSRSPMSSATAYRRISRIIEESNIDVKHTGGRVLRNSFAIHQIESGMEQDDICELMGIKEKRSLKIYMQIVKTKTKKNKPLS